MFPVDEQVIAGWTVRLAGAWPQGVPPLGTGDFEVPSATDATQTIQSALDACSATGGGTIFVYPGRYTFGGDATLTVPDGCHLRGDWRNPDSAADAGTHQSAGTVFHVTANETLSESAVEMTRAFVQLAGSAGVSHLTFYYPNQTTSADGQARFYPPTIRTAVAPDYRQKRRSLTARNLTLLNSWFGIFFDYSCDGAGGPCANPDPMSENGASIQLPLVQNVYGTPLRVGVKIADASAFPRVQGVHFGPEYWADGFVDAQSQGGNPPIGRPAVKQLLKTWNATAINLHGNGSGDVSDSEVRSYAIGVLYDDPIAGGSNGKISNSSFTDVGTGVVLAAEDADLFIVGSTVQATGSAIKTRELEADRGGAACVDDADCERTSGVVGARCRRQSHVCNVPAPGGTISTQEVELESSSSAPVISLPSAFTDYSLHLVTTHLTGRGPAVDMRSTGFLTVEGSQLDTAAPQYLKTGGSPATLVKNTYAVPEDTSQLPDGGYENNAPPFSFSSLPTLAPLPPRPGPTSTALEIIEADRDGGVDATKAIQEKLDRLQPTGGTAFLPPGRYRLDGRLTVPAGVELRGAADLPFYTYIDTGSGRTGANTVLLTHAPPGTAAVITLRSDGVQGSGVRGLMMWARNMNLEPTPEHGFTDLPFQLRAAGPNCWVLNVLLPNAARGLDLLGSRNNPTTGHYVEGLSGTGTTVMVRVGGSAHGVLRNVQTNQSFWERTEGLPVDPDLHRPGNEGAPGDRHSELSESGTWSVFRGDSTAVLLHDANHELILGSFFHGPRFGVTARALDPEGPSAADRTGPGFVMVNSGAEVKTALRLLDLLGDDGDDATSNGATVVNSTWHTLDAPDATRSNCSAEGCVGEPYVVMDSRVPRSAKLRLFSAMNWSTAPVGFDLRGGKTEVQQYTCRLDRNVFLSASGAATFELRAGRFPRQDPTAATPLVHARVSDAARAAFYGTLAAGTWNASDGTVKAAPDANGR